ncbi:protoporphyrinogen oxidase [soil metagenome]|jgi:oxygen-dependent protoporphyrinogen oxidase
MQLRPRVVIVGGGISGLATAHALYRRFGDDVQLTLVEAGSQLGGKVATRQFSGHQVDTGPDALLVRVPAMAALLEELGLSDQIVAPAALGAHVWSRGHLRRLPTGTLFGIPDRLIPLLRSRLLSLPGVARAALDLTLPRHTKVSDDPSIGELVTPRLGSQAFARLVEPLLGGVHAGRADELSAASTVPDLATLARNNRSLYLGLRRLRRNAPPPSGVPMLITLTGGLGELVAALVAQLGQAEIRLNSSARLLARDGDGYRIDLDDATSLAADAVVLATPAFVGAALIADLAPGAATVLDQIPYVDVATIWLAYRRSALGVPLDGTGFLVPPEEGKLLVGCTWSSAKWPHLADDAVVLIRGMVGRRGDRRWVSMDDETLARQVHEELVQSMRLTEAPLRHRIQRWPQAMPQYLVGHRSRLDALGTALRDVPGLYLTGAAYRGVGIASCVADAGRIAAEVAQHLTPVADEGIPQLAEQPSEDHRPLTEVPS